MTTHDNAALDTIRDASTDLANAKEGVRRARDRQRAKQATFDRAVAEAVSSEPKSPAWWAHDGYASKAEVMEAAKLNAEGLDATMRRYRER